MSSELALAAAQSMLENGADEDMEVVRCVARSLRTGVGTGEGSLKFLLKELTQLRKRPLFRPEQRGDKTRAVEDEMQAKSGESNSVFAFGNESWSWSRTVIDKIKGWETELIRFSTKEAMKS